MLQSSDVQRDEQTGQWPQTSTGCLYGSGHPVGKLVLKDNHGWYGGSIHIGVDPWHPQVSALYCSNLLHNSNPSVISPAILCHLHLEVCGEIDFSSSSCPEPLLHILQGCTLTISRCFLSICICYAL